MAAPVAPPVESMAEGIRTVARILAAAQNARWPMYVRNVKQVLRAADGGFDERRYGFNGLIDLLRACQREGIVRLERDRRGGLRVFQGLALAQQRAAAAGPHDVVVGEPAQGAEATPGEQPYAPEPAEVEPPVAETTGGEHLEAQPPDEQPQNAQKPKRARGRGGRRAKPAAGAEPGRGGERAAKPSEPAMPRGTRKTGARKAAGGTRRTSTRTRRPAASDQKDDSSSS